MANQLYTHWVELITAESAESRFVRHRRFIRFRQLTMPLIAAHTPSHWRVTHTDEIVRRVRYDKPFSLVAIPANTAAAPHAYRLAARYREQGIPVVSGGPHATLMPDEVMQHADAVVVGEGGLVWRRILEDWERGQLARIYRSDALPDLKGMPSPRWDLLLLEKMFTTKFIKDTKKSQLICHCERSEAITNSIETEIASVALLPRNDIPFVLCS